MAAFRFFLILTMVLWAIFMFWSCASIRAPLGGPKDTIPPFVLGSIPKNYTRNFKGKNITILFDEFVKVKDANTSVQISPELDKPPTIRIVKKSIEIVFLSPLASSRTYSINFGNSIIDYNEGNILKNYRFVLSTGPFLDSLKISGTVSDALDTSAKKDVYVIIHKAPSDSAIFKKKPFLYTTTDDRGNFSLENLPPGEYNVYALLETNKNKIYDSKAESIAFLSKSITLKKDTSGLALNLFKEREDKLLLQKKSVRDGLIQLYFNQPPDSLKIEPVKVKDGPFIIEKHGKGDSIYVWMPSTQLDSVQIQVQYKNKKPVLITQQNYNKPKKPSFFTTSDNIEQNLLAPNQKLELIFNRPVKRLNLTDILLFEDSLKTSIDSLILKDSSYRHYTLYYPWQTKKQYKLGIKPGTIKNIYGGTNLEYNHSFQFGGERNYGSINLKLTIPHPGHYIIMLMDEKFNLVKSQVITQNTTLNYKYILPGKYRIRVIYDTNKNGQYDTGNLLQKYQPEKIINSKEIIIRSNFEINPAFPLPN